VSHYVGVFLLLMCLTALTVAVAMFDFGRLNTVVALAVAGCKATAVIWIFMEVRHAQPLTRLTVVTGIFFLAILLIFTFGDYGGRAMVPMEKGWRGDGPHSVGTIEQMEPKPAESHAPAKH
jgi:cytochrome c oxidase subunit 4